MFNFEKDRTINDLLGNSSESIHRECAKCDFYKRNFCEGAKDCIHEKNPKPWGGITCFEVREGLINFKNFFDKYSDLINAKSDQVFFDFQDFTYIPTVEINNKINPIIRKFCFLPFKEIISKRGSIKKANFNFFKDDVKFLLSTSCKDELIEGFFNNGFSNEDLKKIPAEFLSTTGMCFSIYSEMDYCGVMLNILKNRLYYHVLTNMNFPVQPILFLPYDKEMAQEELRWINFNKIKQVCVLFTGKVSKYFFDENMSYLNFLCSNTGIEEIVCIGLSDEKKMLLLKKLPVKVVFTNSNAYAKAIRRKKPVKVSGISDSIPEIFNNWLSHYNILLS